MTDQKQPEMIADSDLDAVAAGASNPGVTEELFGAYNNGIKKPISSGFKIAGGSIAKSRYIGETEKN